MLNSTDLQFKDVDTQLEALKNQQLRTQIETALVDYHNGLSDLISHIVSKHTSLKDLKPLKELLAYVEKIEAEFKQLFVLHET